MSDSNDRKQILKLIWRWIKILGFLFIIISMIWGCVQMYQDPYLIQEVTDMTGRKVYMTGFIWNHNFFYLVKNHHKLSKL